MHPQAIDRISQAKENMPRRAAPGIAATMIVHFTSYQDQVAYGELEVPSFDHVFAFHGMDKLLLLMEDIMDSVEYYPQRFFKKRTIASGSEDTGCFLAPTDRTTPAAPCSGYHKITVPPRRSLVIQVRQRQHASMQGEIRIKNQRICFRSGMELMRMLHEFLGHAEIRPKAARVVSGRAACP